MKLCALAFAVAAATLANPLPTGVALDPAGVPVPLGTLPLALAVAPDRAHVAVILSGWTDQGVQIVDLAARRVTQTLVQPGAFYGVAFSHDGKRLYVSGGNDDSVFCYTWRDGAAALDRRIVLGQQKEDKTGSRYPAGIAVSDDDRALYVAENVSDTVAVVDLATDRVRQRLPAGHYPLAVESAHGRVYVSAWGGDSVTAFRADANGLSHATPIRVGRHPSALRYAHDRLYVALSGSDRVAVVDTRSRRVVMQLDDGVPNAPHQGSTPNALAVSADGRRVYVAEADSNAVSVFDPRQKRPVGRIPTDWYPTAVVAMDNALLVLSGKGSGPSPNPDGPRPGQGPTRNGYVLGQLHGSLRIIAPAPGARALAAMSRRVAAANHWRPRTPTSYPPFRHVIYIIKENRTYDQVLGDMPEGDGDRSLLFFGNDVAPNHRALARRFGLFDRFFTNAEVSSQGHLWSTAAYVPEYAEKLVPSAYSDRAGDIDLDDANIPAGGFLWTLAARRGVTFRDYGEFVHGDKAAWSRTAPGLEPNVSRTYPVSDLMIPDQNRADAWLAEFARFAAEGNMPSLQVMHLPGDHTGGGRAGVRTPRAYMADNDLALARIVDAVSRSRFWRDTVIFVVEDDAQAGPDHVDSHRSVLFVISAYSRPGTHHRFVNTTDVVAAIEDILHLDRLSAFDYFSRPLTDVFAKEPDLAPYAAMTPAVDLHELNPPRTAAARESEHFDLSAPDRIDDAAFNAVLWHMLKPGMPYPEVARRTPLHALCSR